eukprot:87831_1
MAINRSACPYCAAEVAASNWHLHVKNCSVRTIQYYQWTKPISKESVNVKFWQCNKCQLHNYESAKQCVACGYAKDSAKLDSIGTLRNDTQPMIRCYGPTHSVLPLDVLFRYRVICVDETY